jgi:hypothetical protein
LPYYERPYTDAFGGTYYYSDADSVVERKSLPNRHMLGWGILQPWLLLRLLLQ